MKSFRIGFAVALGFCGLHAAGPDNYGYPPYLWQNTQTIG